RIRPAGHNSRAQHQCFDLSSSKHKGWEVEALAQHVAHTRLALDRYARHDEIADVAVDGTLRHLQRLRKRRGRRDPMLADELDDLEQAVCAPHRPVSRFTPAPRSPR